MGRRKRTIPANLGQKLKAIREYFGLTGEQLIERLDCPSIALYPSSITEYEKGRREPPSIVLLGYSNLANVTINVLVDDKVDLPLK